MFYFNTIVNTILPFLMSLRIKHYIIVLNVNNTKTLNNKVLISLTFDEIDPQNYRCSPYLINYTYSRSEVDQNSIWVNVELEKGM